MNYIVYSSLFVTVFLSGLSVFLIKKNKKNTIKLLTSFSGAYLLALTFLHLIPEIYINNDSSIGLYILIGFFLQILLELFSEGVEHGHSHIADHDHGKNHFPLAMMISLCIHSLVEGMPLAFGFENHAGEKSHFAEGSPLLLGIILHKIPVSIVLMTTFLQAGISKKRAITLLAILALMSPLGVIISYLVGEQLVSNISLYFDKTLAIVIGIFLHISTTILFESSENHRFNIYKFITIILGAIIAFLTL